LYDLKDQAACTILLFPIYDNSIRLFAYDKKRLKSEVVKADFQYSSGSKGPGSKVMGTLAAGQGLGDSGKRYAVIIGISEYKDLSDKPKMPGGLVDLKYADDDAAAFKQFLETKERSGGNWDIRYLVNQDATSKRVDDELTGILTDADAGDLIFIFFSGHGRSHKQTPQDIYLLTHDFEEGSYRTGFSYDTLKTIIARSAASHIIAFIDACRSGAMGFGGKGEPVGSFDQSDLGNGIKGLLGQQQKKTRANRVIFSSGQGREPAWEDDDLGKGVFTHFLLKGLTGDAKEKNNPQFIDLGELSRYVTKPVGNYIRDKKNTVQVPQIFEANGDPNKDFPVAYRIGK
jgi:uncharacterized caspase-like protein